MRNLWEMCGVVRERAAEPEKAGSQQQEHGFASEGTLCGWGAWFANRGVRIVGTADGGKAGTQERRNAGTQERRKAGKESGSGWFCAGGGCAVRGCVKTASAKASAKAKASRKGKPQPDTEEEGGKGMRGPAAPFESFANFGDPSFGFSLRTEMSFWVVIFN